MLFFFLLPSDVIAQIVQALELLFAKMNLIQCAFSFLIEHPHPLGFCPFLLHKKPHVGLNFSNAKTYIVQVLVPA